MPQVIIWICSVCVLLNLVISVVITTESQLTRRQTTGDDWLNLDKTKPSQSFDSQEDEELFKVAASDSAKQQEDSEDEEQLIAIATNQIDQSTLQMDEDEDDNNRYDDQSNDDNRNGSLHDDEEEEEELEEEANGRENIAEEEVQGAKESAGVVKNSPEESEKVKMGILEHQSRLVKRSDKMGLKSSLTLTGKTGHETQEERASYATVSPSSSSSKSISSSSSSSSRGTRTRTKSRKVKSSLKFTTQSPSTLSTKSSSNVPTRLSSKSTKSLTKWASKFAPKSSTKTKSAKNQALSAQRSRNRISGSSSRQTASSTNSGVKDTPAQGSNSVSLKSSTTGSLKSSTTGHRLNTNPSDSKLMNTKTSSSAQKLKSKLPTANSKGNSKASKFTSKAKPSVTIAKVSPASSAAGRLQTKPSASDSISVNLTGSKVLDGKPVISSMTVRDTANNKTAPSAVVAKNSTGAAGNKSTGTPKTAPVSVAEQTGKSSQNSNMAKNKPSNDDKDAWMYSKISSNKNKNNSETKSKDKNKIKTKSKIKLKNNNKNIQFDDSSVTAGNMFPPSPQKSANQLKGVQLANSCTDLRCFNGGLCINEPNGVWNADTVRMRTGNGAAANYRSGEVSDSVRCQCPLGFRGRLCDKEVVIRYPRFRGTGYVAFPVLRGAFKEFRVVIQFRPETSTTGLLLYSADQPQARQDFFSIGLLDGGHVEFRFDCGTGMGLVRTKNKVELGQWNTLRIHRTDWNGYVQLNDGPETKGKSKLFGWTYAKNSYGTYQWTHHVAPPGPVMAPVSSWNEKWKSSKSNDIRDFLSTVEDPSQFYRPKGIFTKMTFREELYLGGYRHVTSLENRTGVAVGFTGCVRQLIVNNKLYDMRKGAFVGDAQHGLDVDECNANSCDSFKCYNGGTCVADGADSNVCLCPLGAAGNRCQTKIDIQMPSFDGHSYLQYIGLRRTVLAFAEIELVFRASHPDGVLLYNGYATDGTGDFLSLSLRNGTLEYRFDLGTGPAIIRSAQPVSLNEWHVVRLLRSGRSGVLQVDSQPQINGTSQGAFTQLTLTLDLFIGGHRNYDEVAKAAGFDGQSLRGCIQKVSINERSLKLLDEALTGVNIDNCASHVCSAVQPCRNGGQCQPIKDNYKCICPLGFENHNCEDRKARYRYRYRYRRDADAENMNEAANNLTAPLFTGTGFLLFTKPQIIARTHGYRFDLQLRVKPMGANGLLIWVGETVDEEEREGARDFPLLSASSQTDYLALGLLHGQVQFGFNLGSGETVAITNRTRIDDNHWHSIRVHRWGSRGFLEIDGGKEIVELHSPGSLEQLNTDGTVYIGGMNDISHRTMSRYHSGYIGCITNVTIATDYRIDLTSEADAGNGVEQCGAETGWKGIEAVDVQR